MGSSREERVARNEELFQVVNRQIEKLEKTLGARETFSMVCECGKKHCLDGFDVEAAVYKRVRANPLLFFVVPGHEDSHVENVIERTPKYLVVEKVGRAAEVVRDE
jgi:5-bromo-4-chloroindolyl phosphate hydrolysis protein